MPIPTNHQHRFVYNDDGRIPPNFSCECGEVMKPATFAAWVNRRLTDPKAPTPRRRHRSIKTNGGGPVAEKIAQQGGDSVLVRHALRLYQAGRGDCELIFSFLSHPETGQPATVWRENGRLFTYYESGNIQQEEGGA